jgi:hypothetical protein
MVRIMTFHFLHVEILPNTHIPIPWCLYDLCNGNTACLHPSSHNTRTAHINTAHSKSYITSGAPLIDRRHCTVQCCPRTRYSTIHKRLFLFLSLTFIFCQKISNLAAHNNQDFHKPEVL